jgi:hypothetical protein
LANFQAIRSVGNSIVKYLDAKAAELRADMPVTFRLISGGELADDELDLDSTVTLYLYRVTVNDHLRNVRPSHAPQNRPPLGLNLHYLVTVWAKSADVEHALLGWTMRHMHQNPILDRSSLMADGGWASDETIHVAPEELSNEDLLRLWDALTPPYRLSYSYVARVVLIDSELRADGPPVIATRFTYSDGAR